MKKLMMIGKYHYKLFLSKKQIKAHVKDMAKKIVFDYRNDLRDIVIISVLNGGNYFAGDLAREMYALGRNVMMDHIRLGRYSKDEETGNKLKITCKPQLDLSDKIVIFVEDIIDQAVTLIFLNNELKEMKIGELQYCVFGVKRKHKRLGFKVKYKILTNLRAAWLVGYGMDSDKFYRPLYAIYVKISKKSYSLLKSAA